MAERAPSTWRYRLLFVALAVLIVFVQLLPINPGPDQIPGPDLLLLIALSWTAVRPRLLPVWLLAAVFLVADLLFMRPPGLWAALVVLACEFLRSRRDLMKYASFPMEWFIVAAIVAVMTVANALILGIFTVPQPTTGLTVIRMLFTILCYPLVVILAGRAFGVRARGVEHESLSSVR